MIVPFLRSRLSIPLATWTQTILVGVTVLYGACQLNQLVEQNQIPKRTEFNDRYEAWRKSYRQGAENVIRWSYQARIRSISPEQLSSYIGKADLKEMVKDYLEFATNLEDCADQGVCFEAPARELLCQYARRLYPAINARGEIAPRQRWKDFELWQFNPELEGLVSRNCGRWTRFTFWFREGLGEALSTPPASEPETAGLPPVMTGPEGAGGPVTPETGLPQTQPSTEVVTEIFFATGSHELTHDHDVVLSKLAAGMNEKTVVSIEGYTDARGIPMRNVGLGWLRANAVRSRLVAKGAAAIRVSISSHGPEKALCTDSSESCWSRNRRVVLRVQ